MQHADNAPYFRPGRWTALALAAVLAAGCSVLQEDRIDYRSAKRGSTLEVPPDLTQLSRDSRYTLPGEAATASGYQAAAGATPGAVTAPQKLGDVRIERAGNQRWLVVDRPPEQLWGPVREFWKDNGFVLEIDQERLGIMETDWAENRAKIPQDFIRRTIGRVFDNLYSTAERDRFRTRFERTASGGTEIYITHRGMEEVYTSTQKDHTVWQPRPADPELEAEFLRRLMIALGASEEQAKAAAATAPASPAVQHITLNGAPALQFTDDFDRAWRRVGLSLDRSGFTVEDRDRSQGVYFVRYVKPNPDRSSKPGLFSRLFGRSGTSSQAAPERQRVVVRTDSNNVTTVSVQDAQGRPDAGPNAQTIVKVLAEDLH